MARNYISFSFRMAARSIYDLDLMQFEWPVDTGGYDLIRGNGADARKLTPEEIEALDAPPSDEELAADAAAQDAWIASGTDLDFYDWRAGGPGKSQQSEPVSFRIRRRMGRLDWLKPPAHVHQDFRAMCGTVQGTMEFVGRYGFLGVAVADRMPPADIQEEDLHAFRLLTAQMVFMPEDQDDAADAFDTPMSPPLLHAKLTSTEPYQLVFEPVRLLDLIWLRTAEDIGHGTAWRICKYCREQFSIETGKRGRPKADNDCCGKPTCRTKKKRAEEKPEKWKGRKP